MNNHMDEGDWQEVARANALSEHVVNVSPTGVVKAMHNDRFSLGFLGPQRIVRASDIRFDEESQAWGIWFNIDGEYHPPLAAYAGFDSYENARSFEVMVMNTAMQYRMSPMAPSIEAWAAALRAGGK